jgi:pyrimidine-specific ribonucleoside hydrolase
MAGRPRHPPRFYRIEQNTLSPNVILDVDTGIDDALAILFALRHPDINLLAITCVAGNASLGRVVSNTLKVLDVAGSAEVPVAAGADAPLIESRRHASHVHGSDGMADLDLPESDRKPARLHAVELLRHVLLTSDDPVTIVTLAPMTNIALLLRTYPEVKPRIARIVAMGGTASGGNATAVAEFNVWNDPEAAYIVFNAGIPLTMYGLDAFNQVSVDRSLSEACVASPDPVARFAGKLLSHPVNAGGTDGHHFGLIGDAGAVCAVVDPGALTVERLPANVELHGGTRGQTIVDRRTHTGEDVVHGLHQQWPLIDVVLDVDAGRYLRLFCGTLGLQEQSPRRTETSLPVLETPEGPLAG